MMSYMKALILCLLVVLLLPAHADDDTKAKVQKDKDKLAKALGDDEAAWNDYLQAYGNGDVMNLLAGPKTNGLSMPDRADHFKKTFKQALKTMDKMNKDAEKSGNVDVAFSITPFSHLESADFAAIRASGLLPTDTTASLRLNRLNPVALAAPVDPALASAATLAAPADANATAAEPSIGNRKLLQVGTTCASNAGQVAYPYSTTIAATAVDWQAAGYVTPVRNQAQCGCCVAFATTAVTEFVLIRRSAVGVVNSYGPGYYTSGTTDLSEQNMMGCEPMYNGCNGAPLSLYFSSTNCRGQGFEAQYPYQAVDTGSCPADALRTSTKAALNLRWASVPKTNAGLMKAVTNAPTVVGVKADGTAFQYYSSGVIPCTTEATATTVNHAVTVIGYGADTTGKRFWRIKNSWGTWWGEQGYIRLQKDCGTSTGPFAMFSAYSAFIAPVL